MKRLLSIIVILTVSWTFFAQGQSPQVELDNLKEKVNKLENKINVIEMHKINLDDKFQNKSESLDIQVREIEAKLIKDYNYIEILVWSFGSIAILGLLTLFISIFRYIHKIAKAKVDEKFDALFNAEKDKLVQLIDNQITENSLRKNKKILVITSNSSDDTFIRRFFRGMEFEKVEFKSISSYSQVDRSFDLVFINNESGTIDNEVIEDYINRGNNRLIFHFGASRLPEEWVKDNKIALANYRVQLYGNLINTLKYQEIA